MPVCEKCWSRAFRREQSNPYKSQVEHYSDILKEMELSGKICILEEQKGEENEAPETAHNG